MDITVATTSADCCAALERYRARGLDPFPSPSFRGRRTAAQVHAAAAPLQPGGVLTGPCLRAAGRVAAARRHGRLAFLDLEDRTGVLQLLLDERVLGADAFALALEHQRGDHVGVAGDVMRTRRGEPSLAARDVVLLSKTLIPPPDGLRDPEVRQRHREADLIANPQSRALARTRSDIVRATREFFHERDFIEVETPILQSLYGGAEARPFVTHHHALDQDMYLRIAPELYLKRCIVGGLERVFEIGRNFRNEGISTKHNPEFTALEYYEAYADYHDLAAAVETLVGRLAVVGKHPDAEAFAPPWPRVRLHEAILAATGLDILAFDEAAGLHSAAVAAGCLAPTSSRPGARSSTSSRAATSSRRSPGRRSWSTTRRSSRRWPSSTATTRG